MATEATVDSRQLCHHCHAVISASAQGSGLTFPRASGVFLKEQSIPDIQMAVKCFAAFADMQSLEYRLNYEIPNAFSGNSVKTVIVSGNTYNNCLFLGTSSENRDIKISRYTLNFSLGNQGTTTISADLQKTAGTKATFVVPATQVLDRTIRAGGTFTFWNHAFANASSSFVTNKILGSTQTLKPIGGGLISLSLQGIVIGANTSARLNIEKYFLSLARDATGRIGTLTVSENTYSNCFLQSFSMSNEDTRQVAYSANFLMSAA